jgi:uncharacterized protein with GYD domain
MLFCLSAEYTGAALTALRAQPTTNRREAASQLVEAAGGKIVDMWGTITNGPGALLIFDVPDPQQAAAICGIIKSSGAVENVRITRLFTMDEIIEVRGKAKAIAGAYKPAGQ